MAKKTRPEESLMPMIISTFKDVVFGDLISRISDRVHRIEDKVFKTILSFIMFIAGVLSLFISLIFFMREYLQLSFTVTFFIVGLVFMVFAFAFIYSAKND